MAKAPVAGRVKTGLCPPCSPEEAAALAEAALADTLDVLAALPARRHVWALDGPAQLRVPSPFGLIPQRGDGLGERLASAFEDVGGPALLVGMDTPQLSASLLRAAVSTLMTPGIDAVLGPAADGGYWAIGLHEARREVFDGVPMSTPGTGAAQVRQLRLLGLRTMLLPPLEDVDDIASARAVARLAPHTRFAARLLGG
ncbi:MAG: TIGR04282 family arsenosugar biosynthesis glycosyltransferase [Acidimicrobiales bacterium]